MQSEIQEYSSAFTAHLEALAAEYRDKLKVRQSYYRLMKSREALRLKEAEMITDSERLLTK